jgi:hypothetical protein
MSWTLRIELLEGNYIYLLLFILLTDCSDSLIYFMFIYFRGTKQLYGNQWMTIYLWIKVRLFQIKDREYRYYQKLTIPRTWQQDEKTEQKHNTIRAEYYYLQTNNNDVEVLLYIGIQTYEINVIFYIL